MTDIYEIYKKIISNDRYDLPLNIDELFVVDGILYTLAGYLAKNNYHKWAERLRTSEDSNINYIARGAAEGGFFDYSALLMQQGASPQWIAQGAAIGGFFHESQRLIKEYQLNVNHVARDAANAGKIGYVEWLIKNQGVNPIYVIRGAIAKGLTRFVESLVLAGEVSLNKEIIGYIGLGLGFLDWNLERKKRYLKKLCQSIWKQAPERETAKKQWFQHIFSQLANGSILAGKKDEVMQLIVDFNEIGLNKREILYYAAYRGDIAYINFLKGFEKTSCSEEETLESLAWGFGCGGHFRCLKDLVEHAHESYQQSLLCRSTKTSMQVDNLFFVEKLLEYAYPNKELQLVIAIIASNVGGKHASHHLKTRFNIKDKEFQNDGLENSYCFELISQGKIKPVRSLKKVFSTTTQSYYDLHLALLFFTHKPSKQILTSRLNPAVLTRAEIMLDMMINYGYTKAQALVATAGKEYLFFLECLTFFSGPSSYFAIDSSPEEGVRSLFSMDLQDVRTKPTPSLPTEIMAKIFSMAAPFELSESEVLSFSAKQKQRIRTKTISHLVASTPFYQKAQSGGSQIVSFTPLEIAMFGAD